MAGTKHTNVAYVSLPDDQVKTLRRLLNKEMGTSVRKGVTRILSTYVRDPAVRELVQSKAVEIKLKELEEEAAQLRSAGKLPNPRSTDPAS